MPIIREVIEVQCDETRALDEDIGYIRLSSFSERSVPELEQALTALERRGMQSLILDLRGNPGGLLTAAIEIADKFVAKAPFSM